MPVHQLVGKSKRQRSDEADPSPPVRRAPLIVGAANDWAEQAADRAGHAALARLRDAAKPAELPSISLSPDAIDARGGELPDHLQARIDTARTGGGALPTAIRRRMEGAFGTSFANVRVHHDEESHRLSRDLSARAFTSGNDIFFGAGQFSPETAAGQQVLAHELAHTAQQPGVHRAVIHRWNINAPVIDWGQTRTIGTIDSGQAVWFFEDTTGDKIVVKNERLPIGLAELSRAMHERISGVDSVKHRKLSDTDKRAVGGYLTDQQGGRLDRESWTRLGTATRAKNRYMMNIRNEVGEERLNAMSDFEIGQYIHASMWSDRDKFVAMTYAAGDTATKTAQKEDRDVTNQRQGGDLQQNRLRALMTDMQHVVALGKLTAVDLFLGNRDRVMAGNLGNWIYTPDSATMTAIDHVDGTVSGYFGRDSQDQGSMGDLLGDLKKARLARTARDGIAGIANGAKVLAHDDGFDAWLDADGGKRRTRAEEAFLRGLEEGRKLLVKTFTATRFSGSKKARAVKKAIKGAAREGRDLDANGDDRDYYYRVLKARAQYLTKG